MGTVTTLQIAANDQVINKIPAHGRSITGLAISDRFLVTAGGDGWIRVWNPQLREDGSNVAASTEPPLRNIAIAFSPDDRIVCTGCFDGLIQTWDGQNWTEIGKDQVHSASVKAIGFVEDRIISVADDGFLRLRSSTHPYKLVKSVRAHQRPVHCFDYSPDERVLATGSFDGTFNIWSYPELKKLQSVDAHNHWVVGIQFLPKSSEIATCSWDSTIRFWDRDGNEHLRSRIEAEESVTCFDFCSDGERLAYGTRSGKVVFVNGRVNKETRELQCHHDYIASLEFSRNDRTLLTTSDDGKACLWDCITGELLLQLDHPEKVTSASFSHSEDVIVTTCDDGLVRHWHGPKIDGLPASK